MPEGHTLHRLARLHQRRYAGTEVRVSSPQGRFERAASIVDGRKFVRAEAHGKHLLHVYGPDAIVHVHLGLAGSFAEHEVPATPPVGQVRMRIVGETHWTDLRAPNICELLTIDQVAALRHRLGPDPLRKDADPAPSFEKVLRSKLPIAVLLMDQKLFAGVGNVYRAEILYRHRIDPMREGRDLDHDTCVALWDDLVALMKVGVRTGRIDTVRPEHEPRAMGRPPRRDRHGGEVYVYRRTGQPCLVCRTPIAKAELAGRNLYWCPTCQAST